MKRTYFFLRKVANLLKRFFPLGALLLFCGSLNAYMHTAFYSPVCIKPYKNYTYHTCHDINFMVNKKAYILPKGFKTDLASIPRFAWPVMSPAHSSLIRSAIIHDWFYRKNHEVTRKEADLIFYHMLKNDGVGQFRSVVMFLAVRLCGFQFYK